jgi:two-component system KDP operon response regulator KdpE
MNEHILVVEDDPTVVEILSGALQHAGYAVTVARDGEQALACLREEPFSLVILDVFMPRMDGWETLRRIREFSIIPVIMLTGLDDDLAQVRGLEAGADDYVVKPTSVAVIRARVRATLRRAKQPSRLAEPVLSFDNGALVIDRAQSRVTVCGAPANLTPTEYRLLLYLVSSAGQPVPHREVLTAVWGPGYDDPEVLKLFISRLRSKVEPDPSQPRYISTRRGRGYYFAAEEDVQIGGELSGNVR